MGLERLLGRRVEVKEAADKGVDLGWVQVGERRGDHVLDVALNARQVALVASEEGRLYGVAGNEPEEMSQDERMEFEPYDMN